MSRLWTLLKFYDEKECFRLQLGHCQLRWKRQDYLRMEVVPDPDNAQQGFELRRTWIQPINYLPTAYTEINCDNLVWKLNQKEAYQLVLDTCLAPKLDKTQSVSPYVTQLAWSPAGMLCHRGCLLASVTNYGCVVIQVPEGKRWKVLVNVSSLWVEKCASDWDSCDSYLPKDQFDILHARVNKMKATSITWSSFIGDRKFCLLIIAVKDGTLLFWQINVAKSTRDKDVEPKLLLQYDTHQYHITTMHWMTKDANSGILCVGDVRGVIKIYSLKCQEDELSCVSSADLWPHSDRIQVTKLCTMPSNNSEITVIATKGSFVIAIALDAECSVMRTKPYHVGNLSINGMVSLDSSNLLVMTHSGSFSHINISQTGAELEIQAQSLNTITAPKSAYYGISSSFNKAIFCLVTSFNMMFDHLLQREPAQIIFFKLCGMQDPYQTLLSNPSQILTRHWDYLEIIRLQGPPFPDVEQEQEQLSCYNLKIRMWLYRFAVMQEDPEEDAGKRNAMRERLRKAEHLVLTQHMSKYVKKLTSQKSLSNQDRQSLALILSWVKKIEPELRSSEVTAILKYLSDIPDLPDRELCAICQQDCQEAENPTESKCVAGHVLPRCSISMLQCSEIPFWICEVCHSIANLNADVGEPALCIYCDSLLHLINNSLLGEGEEEEEVEEKMEGIEVNEGKQDDEMKVADKEERDKKEQEEISLLGKETDHKKDDEAS